MYKTEIWWGLGALPLSWTSLTKLCPVRFHATESINLVTASTTIVLTYSKLANHWNATLSWTWRCIGCDLF